MKRTVAATALLLAISSCVSDTAEPAGDVIDRATFVDTYVDLRLAAVQSPDFRVSGEERDEILARHGVRGEDLIRFAEAYGRDLEFMNELWAEVEERFQESSADATPP
jgi:hypothetical protein